MSERINKMYKPSEMEDILSRLKDICHVYLTNKRETDLSNKPIENWIVLALHKQGYRIVKIK